MGMASEARTWNSKMEKKIGPDLVVQRSRYYHFEGVFELWTPAFCMVKLLNFRNGQGIQGQFFFKMSFTFWAFWTENRRKFSGLLRRSFRAGRELRRPKSDHVHPAFSCVFSIVDVQKVMEIQGFLSPFKSLPPGTMPR